MSAQDTPEPTAYIPHPYALLFPAMGEEDRVRHQNDIEENGLLEKITINTKNQILDGVHRFRACTALGIEPVFEVRDLTDRDTLTFVLSRNLQRRHLDASQRAAIAAELANLKRGGKQPANSPDAISQADAAKAMSVSERSTRSAAKVKRTSTALHSAVKSGDLSLHAAEAICDLPALEREKTIAEVQRGDAAKAASALRMAAQHGSDPKADKLHASYAVLLEALDTLPHLLSRYPLAIHQLRDLDRELKRAITHVETAALRQVPTATQNKPSDQAVPPRRRGRQ